MALTRPIYDTYEQNNKLETQVNQGNYMLYKPYNENTKEYGIGGRNSVSEVAVPLGSDGKVNLGEKTHIESLLQNRHVPLPGGSDDYKDMNTSTPERFISKLGDLHSINSRLEPQYSDCSLGVFEQNYKSRTIDGSGVSSYPPCKEKRIDQFVFDTYLYNNPQRAIQYCEEYQNTPTRAGNPSRFIDRICTKTCLEDQLNDLTKKNEQSKNNFSNLASNLKPQKK